MEFHKKLTEHPNPNTPNSSSSSSSSSSSPETNPSKMAENQKPEPPAQQHHKKQVRRRLHTTRPYQERLMNMAEARREIVTALRHHRAAMKSAAGAAVDPDPPIRCQERRIRPRKIPKSSSANFNINNNNNDNNNNMRNLCYPWMMMDPGSNLEIELPEQTLGLNLNLKNLDAALFSNGAVSGSSSSSSEEVKSGGGGCGGGAKHVAVGEEEMAEIRSIGEKHSVEWSDKMSMVKSAWWLRFMDMEEEDRFGFEFELKDPFEQILEFPDWINNGSQAGFHDPQLFSDYHPSSSSALPCMDIGEFEGMDGEWLA